MHDMPLLKEVVLVPLRRSQRRVLIVAQQIELRARIARVLQSAGYAIELAGSRTRALELAAGKKIEVAIVARSSDVNGLGQEIKELVPRTIMLSTPTDEICRSKHLPRGPEVPTQEIDEQKLLDQLREPIALPEGAGDGTSGRPVVLTIEDCRFDVAARVFVDGNGREVPLTRAEFALLAVFTRSPCQVLSRDQLRHAVVGRGAGSDDRSIDMLVARLRRKIEPNPKAPRFIVSVAGVGYRFAVRPQAADHATQEFDEQKLLDQLREPIALPEGASDGTRAMPVVLTIEDCRLDLAAHVFVAGNGREVPLTRAEFALLVVFTGRPRQVLSRDQLRCAVVGRGAGRDDRSIDILVTRLRRKIEPNPKAPRFILSVAGVGYKFAVRPQTADHSNGLATIEPLNRFGLGDDTLAQAQNAGPETPKFTVCVRLQGVEQRTALPLTPSMVQKLAFEACIRNQEIGELAVDLLRMAAEKGLADQLLGW